VKDGKDKEIKKMEMVIKEQNKKDEQKSSKQEEHMK